MIVQRVVRVQWHEVGALAATAREAGGFGHTDAKQEFEGHGSKTGPENDPQGS
jgi:hypothetical protein